MMPRLEMPPLEQLSGDQKAAMDQVSQAGRLGGPYLAYLRTPEFMTLNKATGDYLRTNSVPPRLRRFIILTVARYWRAAFVWAVNVREALANDFDREIVHAINNVDRTAITWPEERAVYDLIWELLPQRSVSDECYGAALALLGEETLVDVIATIGFFTSVCLTVNTFEMAPPEDATHVALASD